MKATPNEQTLVSHEQAIANLIVSYAFANDDADFEKLGDIFSDSVFRLAEITANGKGEIEAVARKIIQITEDGRSTTTHETTNIMIEIDGSSNTAQARSYWTLYKTISGEPRQAIMSGRYQDRFTYDSSRWTFKEREATILWKLDNSIF